MQRRYEGQQRLTRSNLAQGDRCRAAHIGVIIRMQVLDQGLYSETSAHIPSERAASRRTAPSAL